MHQDLGGVRRQACGRLDWAQPWPPRGLAPGKSPTVGPGCRGRCPGRWPSPGASSLCPPGPQLPYACAGPSGSATDGVRGGVCPGYWWLLFWRRRPGLLMGTLFGDGGLGWPGAFPDFLPRASSFTSLHPLDPPESPSPPSWSCPSLQAVSHPTCREKLPVTLPDRVSVRQSFSWGHFTCFFLARGCLCLCSGFSASDPVNRGVPSVSSWSHQLSAQDLNQQGCWQDAWEEGKAGTLWVWEHGPRGDVTTVTW